MDWTQQVDGYCERLGPGLWSEPANALTNAAFIAVGLWCLWRSAGLPRARLLSGILIAIGVGSGLFHTYATAWAGLADVLPIALFILTYIYAIHRDVWSRDRAKSAAFTAGFIPFAAATAPILAQIPGLAGSSAYASVPLLIAIHAWWLKPAPIARDMTIGAALLTLSITARALDMPLCDTFPLGTHFLWHILNAIMLGWMIAAYRRHMLAAPPADR